MVELVSLVTSDTTDVVGHAIQAVIGAGMASLVCTVVVRMFAQLVESSGMSVITGLYVIGTVWT